MRHFARGCAPAAEGKQRDMKNWKIGTRIAAGFGAVIAIAAALGLFAYSRVGNIGQRTAEVTGTSLPSVAGMGRIHTNIEAAMRLVLQHVISSDNRTWRI
jgi:methyl-accepting chemotaxis protein